MLLLVIFLACLFVALGAGVFAALSDFRGLVIPNSYSAIIIGAFVFAYFSLWAAAHEGMFFSLTSHIVSALLIFAATALMFGMRVMGAADSKLATAYAFWVGLPGMLPLVFYTTLAGGVLALVAVLLRKYRPVKSPKEGSWLARLQAGDNKVPYGIAIVAGALASFVKLGYFNGDALSSFLLS